MAAPEAYGSNRLMLWYYGLRDRFNGRSGRANARWGRVTPPAGSGRVIWIMAGASRVSVRLGAELTAAIRHKRLDVRLVFTFEEEYDDLLTARVFGLKKTGCGYGPCDAPRAVARIVARLQPLGVVFAGHRPGAHLLAALERRQITTVAYAADAVPPGHVDTCYPVDEATAQRCREQACARHIALAADPLTILTPAQVEPSFGGLVRGGRDFALWWLHADAAMVYKLLESWRNHGARGVLLWSGYGALEPLEATLHDAGIASVRLSRWRREPIAPGTVVLIDEERWWPACAASAHGVHLQQCDRTLFWQALAGAGPVSVGPDVGLAAAAGLPRVATLDAVFARWLRLHDDASVARREADAGRKRFWDERRRAGVASDEFLQQVYDW